MADDKMLQTWSRHPTRILCVFEKEEENGSEKYRKRDKLIHVSRHLKSMSKKPM